MSTPRETDSDGETDFNPPPRPPRPINTASRRKDVLFFAAGVVIGLAIALAATQIWSTDGESSNTSDTDFVGDEPVGGGSPKDALSEKFRKVRVRRSDVEAAERAIHEHPIEDWSEHLKFEHDSGIGNREIKLRKCWQLRTLVSCNYYCTYKDFFIFVIGVCASN